MTRKRRTVDPAPPTLSIAEQERRFQQATNPGRAMAQDIIAAEQSRIEAAHLTVAERAWVEHGRTWQDRSRRLAEVERTRAADDGHFARITEPSTPPQSRGGDEKPAATRRASRRQKP